MTDSNHFNNHLQDSLEHLQQGLASLQEDLRLWQVHSEDAIHLKNQRMQQFARQYAKVAQLYHGAVLAADRSSIRLQVVNKALDLTTAKSKLQQFLDD